MLVYTPADIIVGLFIGGIFLFALGALVVATACELRRWVRRKLRLPRIKVGRTYRASGKYIPGIIYTVTSISDSSYNTIDNENVERLIMFGCPLHMGSVLVK